MESIYGISTRNEQSIKGPLAEVLVDSAGEAGA